MTADSLRHVFKTLADPTRMRLLVLLEREELAVQELTQILGMAQSTVSRHLAVLRDAKLLEDRREGTFVHYRFRPPANGAWREVWELTKRSLQEDPIAARDRAALAAVLESRAIRTRSWFDAVGPEWDSLRRALHDDTQRARAIAKLVPSRLKVADIGTGTGILAGELAAAGLEVIAVDHSERMLQAARAKLEAQGVTGVDFRQGDVGALPLADGEVDAAIAHMVLHYVASPGEAVAEMTRVTRPGGRVVVVDFVRHDRTWLRERLGVQWLGFAEDTVRGWFDAAGLAAITLDAAEHGGRGADLPATFIASARVPDPSAHP